MRWDDLFRDLEAQLAAAETAEREAEVADRIRRESARLTLVARALGAVGSLVSVRVLGAGDVRGQLREVGSQWLLLADDGGRSTLVPLTAVLGVTGLAPRSDVTTAAGRVFTRLGFGSALRVVARDRATVSLRLADGRVLSGSIDRVGSDFIELTERAVGEVRAAKGSPVWVVPFAAVSLVSSGP
jgi:hypothetical protein